MSGRDTPPSIVGTLGAAGAGARPGSLEGMSTTMMGRDGDDGWTVAVAHSAARTRPTCVVSETAVLAARIHILRGKVFPDMMGCVPERYVEDG
jgi:hypothetical protein